MKQWVPQLFLLVSTLTLCWAIAEVLLRLLGVGYPIINVPDPLTGVWHRPGETATHDLEGESFVSINSDGLRDREHSLVKPKDTYRIAIVGDSYSEAFQVDVDRAFWAVTRERLGTCAALGDLQVETINFGVSGFGTGQQMRVVRHRVWKYDPDLVLLAFVNNDVRNNSLVLERDPSIPYFVLEDGELVLDDSYLTSESYTRRTSTIRRIRREIGARSRVLQLINELSQIRARQEIASSQIAPSHYMYAEPSEPVWIDAWAVTDALILKMAEEVGAKGARFVVAAVTDRYQVDPDIERRQRYLEEVGGEDLRYPEKRLRGLALRGRFELVALAEPLGRYAEATGECLHGFENAVPCGGHWNELGHRLAGEIIADSICMQLAAEGRSAPP